MVTGEKPRGREIDHLMAWDARAESWAKLSERRGQRSSHGLCAGVTDVAATEIELELSERPR